MFCSLDTVYRDGYWRVIDRATGDVWPGRYRMHASAFKVIVEYQKRHPVESGVSVERDPHTGRTEKVNRRQRNTAP